MSRSRVRVQPIRQRPSSHEPQSSSGRPSSQAASFLPPGTPVFVGQRKQARASLHLIHFDREILEEEENASLEDCRRQLRDPGVNWVNVNGVHDVGLIEALGEVFGLHPMTMEDIADTSQRPKWEEFPGYGFMALKMLAISEDDGEVQIEHVSLILGPTWVLTFLEDDGDVFASVRHRIRGRLGRVRGMGADYLASCLVDAVIDHYFLAVEWIGDQVEIFDTRVLSHPEAVQIQEIHHFKRSLLAVRRAVWPLREVLGAIGKSDAGVLSTESSLFWRNLYDHTVQVIDMVETSRDTLASLQDTYLSSLSNRMNGVMKTLTVISTIFIPLTFIAGVYGMNFQHMPELTWRLGYYGVLVLMLVIAVALVVWIRRRGWL